MGILSLLIFLPIVGALVALATRKAEAAKWVALITSIVVFVVSLVVYSDFNAASNGYQLVEQVPWHAWRLLLPRSLPLLRHVGDHPYSDVFHHRCMGW